MQFFDTGPQFVTILRRHRDHAADRDQHDRVEFYAGLIQDVDDNART
jgi:hypothetical protein